MSTQAEVNGVALAIEKAGGRRQLGEKVGVTHEAVRQWLVRGKVPAGKVLDVERATGVRRELLNGDMSEAVRKWNSKRKPRES